MHPIVRAWVLGVVVAGACSGCFTAPAPLGEPSEATVPFFSPPVDIANASIVTRLPPGSSWAAAAAAIIPQNAWERVDGGGFRVKVATRSTRPLTAAASGAVSFLIDAGRLSEPAASPTVSFERIVESAVPRPMSLLVVYAAEGLAEPAELRLGVVNGTRDSLPPRVSDRGAMASGGSVHVALLRHRGSTGVTEKSGLSVVDSRKSGSPRSSAEESLRATHDAPFGETAFHVSVLRVDPARSADGSWAMTTDVGSTHSAAAGGLHARHVRNESVEVETVGFGTPIREGFSVVVNESNPFPDVQFEAISVPWPGILDRYSFDNHQRVITSPVERE